MLPKDSNLNHIECGG